LRYISLLVLLLACACQRLPEVYPPPEQRHPVEGNIGERASMMIEMRDPIAPTHFVQDIKPKLEGGYWRWTGKKPTLKILLVKAQGLKFVSDFTVYEACLKQTGPVTITFTIDGQTIDKQTYTTPGYKHLDKPVNPEWLQTGVPTVISAEIDKLYHDPSDGADLGFILTKIGFERE
jgi:hypothetical protein